jgi:hypothetical protein
MERMGGEEGILPERSEWFRSTRYMSPIAPVLDVRRAIAYVCRVSDHHAYGVESLSQLMGPRFV